MISSVVKLQDSLLETSALSFPPIPAKIRRLAIVVIVVAILLVMYNLAADATIGARFGPDISQFRRSRPAAYASSPFYSLDFIDEQTALSESWHQGDTWSGWDSNFHGRYFNTDHGMRRTAF